MTVWLHRVSQPKNRNPWETSGTINLSLVNVDKIQGSQKPKCDMIESGPKIPAESMQTQFQIMKRAVAKYLSENIKIIGEGMSSLLDSGIMISLMQQSYFNKYFRPQLGPVEEAVAETHNLFNLKSANSGVIPLSR